MIKIFPYLCSRPAVAVPAAVKSPSEIQSWYTVWGVALSFKVHIDSCIVILRNFF